MCFKLYAKYTFTNPIILTGDVTYYCYHYYPHNNYKRVHNVFVLKEFN